jgi:hypothetical protein
MEQYYLLLFKMHNMQLVSSESIFDNFYVLCIHKLCYSDLFHNYTWQGRVLEVREDRGYIDREVHGGNQYHHRGHGGLAKATSTKPIFPPGGVQLNSVYINHVG